MSLLLAMQGGTTYALSVGGTLSLSGGLSKLTSRTLTAGLSFSGGLTKQPARSFGGGLSLSGTLTKLTNRAVGGALSLSGIVTKLTSRTLTAGLTLVGTLATATLRAKALAGGLSFSGAVSGIIGVAPAAAAFAVRKVAGWLKWMGRI